MPTYNVYVTITREGYIPDIEAADEDAAMEIVEGMGDLEILDSIEDAGEEIEVNEAELIED